MEELLLLMIMQIFLVDLGYKVTVLSKEYKNPIQNTKFTYIQVPNKYGEYFWMYNYGTF